MVAARIWNPAPESKHEEVKLLSEAGKPPEAASAAGGIETAAPNGTGCAGEAAKFDWTAAWTVWDRKAANSGEKCTGQPEAGPLDVATLSTGAWLAEDDVLPVEAVLVAATGN